jgi:zinc transport system substrate-binding protein
MPAAVAFALAVGATAALLAGCGGASSADGAPTVVAAFYPLAFAAESIGGDAVTVENMTPPGVEPHDLELSARDVQRITQADVVLFLGGGFQPAIEEAALESPHPVDLLDTIALRGGDPHVWLDPLRYAEIAERVGRVLQPDSPAAVSAATMFADRLRELDTEFRDGLVDCARDAIVTSHEAFGYLAERYGLKQIAVAGIEPEAEPAPQDLERVVEEVRASGATTVFVEPLVAPDLAETIAREASVEVATLNPIEGLTEEQLAAGEDYFTVMRENLAALREGLGCR